MSEFTEGEWRVAHDPMADLEGERVTGKKPEYPSQIVQAWRDIGNKTDGELIAGHFIALTGCHHESKANAHLISAAKDMCEALEQAETSMLDSGYSLLSLPVIAARKALSKARGENEVSACSRASQMSKFSFSDCMENHDGWAVTENGLRVRLLSDGASGDYPICGLAYFPSGKRVYKEYSMDGHGVAGLHDMSPDSIFTPEIPKERIKRELWINLYENCHTTWLSKANADSSAGHDRLACIPITIDVQVGEGLSDE